MRWSNLVGGDAAAAPPGGLPITLPGAVARTFDTPGFAGMTFYEIRAKSLINRVPSASRVPFEWTINPYRGCSHACVYCLSGDTPILMADGRASALADVRVGDRVYGTAREGAYRRYVTTEVLAHWSTVKPAYRVTLADGSQLIASGDHRFLTGRGWKHVTGRMSGLGRRPYLTTGNRLLGTGRFAPPPKPTDDYRRGYLCGMIRGDAHVESHPYPHGDVHRSRLALVDAEALLRARTYLAGFGITTDECEFSAAKPTRQAISPVRTSQRNAVRAIHELTAWPQVRTDSWRRGFLAGVFDAEGSHSGGVMRITNSDQEILDNTASALERFGFAYVVEVGREGIRNIRVLGGLRERLRFLHTVDPAITRKRTIDGVAIRSDAALGVTSVVPLGLDLPLIDITTGTGDFIANGVVSHNCFARNTHSYLDLDTGRDFDTKVIVKVNAGALLRRELAAPTWRGDHIAMGTNVDCYQRAEGRYGLMREILAGLRDHANPFSILTKGTLILRDLDLLRQAAEVTDVGLAVSIGFLDEALWRSVEPGTPGPKRRLSVVRTLADAGFRVSVLMAPVLPGLTDDDASIEATVAAVAAAGAASVTPLVLHLRPGAREWYGRWLATTHPELAPGAGRHGRHPPRPGLPVPARPGLRGAAHPVVTPPPACADVKDSRRHPRVDRRHERRDHDEPAGFLRPERAARSPRARLRHAGLAGTGFPRAGLAGTGFPRAGLTRTGLSTGRQLPTGLRVPTPGRVPPAGRLPAVGRLLPADRRPACDRLRRADAVPARWLPARRLPGRWLSTAGPRHEHHGDPGAGVRVRLLAGGDRARPRGAPADPLQRRTGRDPGPGRPHPGLRLHRPVRAVLRRVDRRGRHRRRGQHADLTEDAASLALTGTGPRGRCCRRRPPASGR